MQHANKVSAGWVRLTSMQEEQKWIYYLVVKGRYCGIHSRFLAGSWGLAQGA